MDKPVVAMRVLRVPPMGKLVVEVNKTRYANLDEVTDDNVKRVIMAAIGELIVFAEGYDNLVEAGVAPPIVQPKPAETVESLAQKQADFLASLEAERDSLQNTEPKKPRFATLAPSRPKDLPPTPTVKKDLSVVEQIDMILQRHLANAPEMAERDIHLQQDASGGLQIKVDGEYFNAPKEINDPKAQAFIKRALKEWEKS